MYSRLRATLLWIVGDGWRELVSSALRWGMQAVGTRPAHTIGRHKLSYIGATAGNLAPDGIDCGGKDNGKDSENVNHV